MVFSSPIFLFLFLPATLLLCTSLFIPSVFVKVPRIKRMFVGSSNFALLMASLFFYFWGENRLVYILVLSTVVNYAFGLAVYEGSGIPWLARNRKTVLTGSIMFNVGLLCYFKYSGFAVGNLVSVMKTFGASAPAWSDGFKVVLPLGISFYTFQAMSYVIDVYRGSVRPARNFIDYACYTTMFAHLVAGPIVRYTDLALELGNRTFDRDTFAYGCKRFVVGLGKKVLIANTAAACADAIFKSPLTNLSMGAAWLGAVCYAVQIYFDFSGYSDMAIGLGRMFGFHFPENFNYPYTSTSIREFWRRWHMTLSSWFRDYVFIPLGGGRRSSARVYFNLIVVFTLCGIWHGANWTFLAWGLYYGVFLVLERVGLDGLLMRLPRPLRHAYVLIVVLVGWVLFRSEHIGDATSYLGVMAGRTEPWFPVTTVPMVLGNDVILALIFGTVFSMPLLPAVLRMRAAYVSRLSGAKAEVAEAVWGLSMLATLVGIMFLCSMSLAGGTYNPFIYFKF